jgi:PPP family 3-phenylpropionic acid transporter
MFFYISSFFFFYFASIGVYIIFLPKILQDINYSSFEIGILFALAPLIRFLTPFVFLKHIKLTKHFFHISLVATLLCALTLSLTLFDFYLLAFNMLLLGFFWGLLLPYIETISLTYIKQIYGKSRLWGSIGFMMTGIVLAKMLQGYTTGLAFYIGFVCFTVIFGYIISSKDSKATVVQNIDEKSIEKFHIGRLKWFWISGAFLQFSFAPFYNFFTIYESSFGHSLEIISYLWAFGVVAEIIMFQLQNPLFRFDLLYLMMISVALTAIRWLLLFLYPDLLEVTFFTQSIHAFSFALHHSAAIIYISKMYSDQKLASQFYYGLSWGLGGLLGSIFSGYLYGEYIFLYSAFFATLSVIMLQLERNQNLSIFQERSK